jgi:hypothetical protein
MGHAGPPSLGKFFLLSEGDAHEILVQDDDGEGSLHASVRDWLVKFGGWIILKIDGGVTPKKQTILRFWAQLSSLHNHLSSRHESGHVMACVGNSIWSPKNGATSI